MATEIYNCPLCAEFHAPTIQLLLPHIRLVHSTQAGFCITCGLHGCQRTFRNMKTFTNHIYQFHMISRTFTMPSQLLPNTKGDYERESSDEDEDMNLDDNYIQPSTSEPNLQSTVLQEEVLSYAAKWILKTREGYKLTQSALENIIQDITSLIQFLLHKTYIAVEEALKNAHISSCQIPDLATVFNPDGLFGRPFQGLESAYQQMKYCREHLGLVVSQSSL